MMPGEPSGTVSAGMSLVLAGCAGLIGLDQGTASAGDTSLPGDASGSADAGDDAADASRDAPAEHRGSPDAFTPDANTPCPLTQCPTGCYDTTSDPAHCGGCTSSCGSGPNSRAICVQGVCGLSCTSGALDCNGSVSDGCECAPVPNGTPYCASGTCRYACAQGFVGCGGSACSCGAGDVCLSSGACGACRAHLQACGANGDCCSGNCVGSACV